MSLTIADYERILTAGMPGVTVHGKITQGNGFISAIKPLTHSKMGYVWAEDVGAMGKALESDFRKILTEIERNSVGIISAKIRQIPQISLDRTTGEIILFALADVLTKQSSVLGNDRLIKLIEEAAGKVGMDNEVVFK